jgi:hypothetical protein
MLGLPEETIQIQVASHFLDLEEKEGGFTFHANIGGSVRVPPHIGKRMKDMGARAGWHDLEFFLNSGKIVLIELKAWDGKLSPAQKLLDGIVTSLGFTSVCVRARTGGEAIQRITEILVSHGLNIKGDK